MTHIYDTSPEYDDRFPTMWGRYNADRRTAALLAAIKKGAITTAIIAAAWALSAWAIWAIASAGCVSCGG